MGKRKAAFARTAHVPEETSGTVSSAGERVRGKADNWIGSLFPISLYPFSLKGLSSYF